MSQLESRRAPSEVMHTEPSGQGSALLSAAPSGNRGDGMSRHSSVSTTGGGKDPHDAPEIHASELRMSSDHRIDGLAVAGERGVVDMRSSFVPSALLRGSGLGLVEVGEGAVEVGGGARGLAPEVPHQRAEDDALEAG